MKRVILWIGFLLFAANVYSQTVGIQDSVAARLIKISETDNDSLKLVWADEVAEWIKKIGFGTYDTQKQVRFLGYKRSDNADIELFSWTVPLKKGLAYCNLFRTAKGRKNTFLKYVPDVENNVPPYLFYDLIPFESDGKDYFVLLGWGQTAKTNQKAVLIGTFDRKGNINFKHPLMRKGKSKSASLTFEYSKEVSMMLKQDKKGKRIIFDHLSPGEKKLEGYFMFYGPDGDIDGLILKKGEWWFTEKIKI